MTKRLYPHQSYCNALKQKYCSQNDFELPKSKSLGKILVIYIHSCTCVPTYLYHQLILPMQSL